MFSTFRLSTTVLLIGALSGVTALAQSPAPAAPAPTGVWRQFGTSPETSPNDQPASQGGSGPTAAPAPAPAPAPADTPATLTLPAGTWISVRTDQALSSDHNQPGDVFTATLVQPLVANGLVVARRGQIISGRVVEAVKAGKVKGTSRLAVELSDISLADGQQLPVRTQLAEYSGGTSKGRDAAAIGTTTAIGAAVGAAADGGAGAGIGAGAGAVASTIGVLLTRGRPTEIFPETTLTFRTLEPVAISTEHSNQAFVPVQQSDYAAAAQRPTLRVAPRPGYYGGVYAPYPYYPYPYYYGPGFYGPSFGVVIRGGRRFR
jgi:hypothetical protein